MTLNDLDAKLTRALHSFLAGEFKLVLGIAAVLFVANLAYSSYAVGFTKGQAFESSSNYTMSGDNRFMIRLRVATSLGLLVCVTGLAFRTLYGVLGSMLGSLWLLFVYGWWQRQSASFLRNLEVTDYSALPDVSHVAGLRGATWWDLFVLVIAGILFIWQGVAIVRVQRSAAH
jgi:hypothetical protein